MKELKEFEKDLIKLVQNIKFRKRSNSFLTTLKKEVNKNSDQKDPSWKVSQPFGQRNPEELQKRESREC